MNNIEYIKQAISKLLGDKNHGHDDKHVLRVYKNAMKFCDEIPNANRELVAAAALLHDCDDYKIFGEESECLLTNTRRILSGSGFDSEFCEKCIDVVKTIGYSKRLKGIKPNCIEAEIVSDADMCDATGFIGLVRCIEYRHGNNEPFFDPDCLPQKVTAENYKQHNYSPVVNHYFDKLLRLTDLALTEPGKKYLTKKHETIIYFLKTYFDEVDAPQVWYDLLKQYE